MPHSRRHGFTLIEVLSALMLTGFVLLGALLLVDQISNGADRIAKESRRVSSEGNGNRLLRRLLLEASLGQDSVDMFRGDANNITMRSLCPTPNGWPEVCHVTLAIDVRADSSIVTAELRPGLTFSLRRELGKAEFRYLGAPSSDSSWFKVWSSNASLPWAIGVVADRDTVVLSVGGIP
jgi:prepilin-type N-terminal cleavage/methylation domain-containing protein